MQYLFDFRNPDVLYKNRIADNLKMSSHHLAQLNIAQLSSPLDSPELADFAANLDRINAIAEKRTN